MAQYQVLFVDATVVLALLPDGILDFEDIGEVAARVIRTRKSTGFPSWLRIVSSSWKPLPTARCRNTDKVALT
jgi:hypothetical protein